MKIPSDEIIQADKLPVILEAASAVANGAQTYQEIASSIGKVERQGRYYRRASEVLGLTTREGRNQSVLTAFGRNFLNSPANERNSLLIQAVLHTRLAQRLIPFLESRGQQGVSRSELIRFLNEIAHFGGGSMASRRITSVVNCLSAVGMVQTDGHRISLQHLPPTVSIVNFSDDEEPLFPIRYELREYETQAREFRKRRQSVAVFIDEAKQERAANSHQMLVDLVASRLRTANAIPKANRYIDLAAKVIGKNFLFEMKSTTKTNVQSQVRRGLSQLYEYRYLQKIAPAKLVLVIENPLPRPLSWLETYLRTDRNVLLVWDGNNRLHCSDEARRQLPFLV